MSVAIIAGEGLLPELIAARLDERGERPVVYAIRDDVSAIEPHAKAIVRVRGTDVKYAVANMFFRRVKRIILAGRVPKTLMYSTKQHDGLAKKLLASLTSRDDHSLLGAVVKLFEKMGFEVVGYDDILSDLIARPGLIAGRDMSDDERADVEYGIDIARAVVPLSFGQSIVVHGRSVVAVEAMEGTDATIERAGSIVRGGVLVKMMKPGQDIRYDIPTVGPRTIEKMAEAGLTCLAVHAGRTLIVERDEVGSLASRCGVSIIGFEEPTP